MDPKVEQENIRAMLGRYGAALEAGDIDAFMQNWRDDGIQLPGDGPNNHGPAAIRSAVGGEMEKLEFTSFKVKPTEITILTEDTAYTWGEYTFSAKGRSQDIALDGVGKFLTILRRDGDGPWGLYRDRFSWVPAEDA